MVIFEFAVPADSFVLASALAAYPEVSVEFERHVPTEKNMMPYLWATDGDVPGFRDAIAADPAVDRIREVAAFEEGSLYGIEWGEADDGFFHHCADTHEETALLQAEAREVAWVLKFRFASRGALSEFRAAYRERDVDVRIIRIYDLAEPMLGQYGITEKQREALLRALEMGHFDIPRETTLEAVADSLGISARSLSGRLRRGQKNLLNSTLVVGELADVGLDDR